MNKYRFAFALLTAASSVLSSGFILAAGSQGTGKLIKCWKNDHGIRECAGVVPPEYSQRRIEVVNERGFVVEVIEPPKTREELEKEREIERLRKEKEAAKKEQEHQDAILLNAYTTERDLLLARDTNLKAAKAQLDIAHGNLKVLQNSLAELQNRAGNYERGGNKVPPELVKQIDQTKVLIAEKENNIVKKEDEKVAMEKRFEQDLQRFRKLKGIKP